MIKILFLITIILFGGCSLNIAKPDKSVPESFYESNLLNRRVSNNEYLEWWKNFEDSQLNALISKALKSNPDVKIAAARIKQAKALIKIAKAGRYPEVTLETGLGYSGKSYLDGSNSNYNSNEIEFSSNITVSYELDFFGKTKYAVNAAQYDERSYFYDKNATVLVLLGDLAQNYFDYLSIEDQIQLTLQTIETEKRILSLAQSLYDAGSTSKLDLMSSRSTLSSSEAALPELLSELKQTELAIKVLLGTDHKNINRNKKSLMRVYYPESIPVGLPSQLLTRRPDIQKAEMDLLSSRADIKAARANLFPSFVLTGKGGYSSPKLTRTNDESYINYSIGLDITVPIFDGGLLKAEVEKNFYYYEELLSNYRNTILTALKDVEESLNSIKNLDKKEKKLLEQTYYSKKAEDLAIVQYSAGYIDYSNVLTAHKTLLSTRNSVIQTRSEKLKAIVTLYKALGGGW